MPAFSIVLTEENVSMRNVDSGCMIEVSAEEIPFKIKNQLKNEIRTSRLKKPICSSRVVNLGTESELYLWYLYEKARHSACNCGV